MIPEPEDKKNAYGLPDEAILSTSKALDEDREDRLFGLVSLNKIDPTINVRDSFEVYLSTMEDEELDEYLVDIELSQHQSEKDIAKVKREMAIRREQSDSEQNKRRDFITQEFTTPVILLLSGSDRHYGVFTNGAEACKWIDAQQRNLRLRFSIIRLRTPKKNRFNSEDWFFDKEDSTEFNGDPND